MKTISFARTFMSLYIGASTIATLAAQTLPNKNDKVIYRGNPTSAISSSVTIPAGKKYFYSSGTLGPVVDSTAANGSRERYGDTKTQALGILEKFKTDLGKEGLSLSNIVFMRVYVAPDTKTGKMDFQGWFDAYGQYFGTKDNPIKPSRSTIGVAQLVNPDRFIEIEIVAVY
ncbi:RidA family protein [Chryseolinea sp. H1M3-3]|uniref:RidA family protein n=1 Tax=Chryseolinea sp. H1M3-3 TaxID=3034144 RepID=UPI0023EBD829|nr:RidA family protein [Chryseolinea sp. H1M3-3]